jgi:hypothetical protein
MAVRVRRATLAGATILASFVYSAAAEVAMAASNAPSPSPTATADKPLVNWTWLATGLGGVIILLAVMFFLSRMFNSRGGRGE